MAAAAPATPSLWASRSAARHAGCTSLHRPTVFPRYYTDRHRFDQAELFLAQFRAKCPDLAAPIAQVARERTDTLAGHCRALGLLAATIIRTSEDGLGGCVGARWALAPALTRRAAGGLRPF